MRRLLTVGTEFYTGEGREYRKVAMREDGTFGVYNHSGIQTNFFTSLEGLTKYYYKYWGHVEVIRYGDETEDKKKVEVELTTDEIGKAVVYKLAKEGKNLPFSTIGLIEEAVFELLLEKKVMEEI